MKKIEINKYMQTFILTGYGCFNIELLRFLVGVVYGRVISLQSLYILFFMMTGGFAIILQLIHRLKRKKFQKMTVNNIALYFTTVTGYAVFAFMIIEQLVKGTNVIMYAAFLFILLISIGYLMKKMKHFIDNCNQNIV